MSDKYDSSIQVYGYIYSLNYKKVFLSLRDNTNINIEAHGSVVYSRLANLGNSISAGYKLFASSFSVSELRRGT
jgi:hypothetical protein